MDRLLTSALAALLFIPNAANAQAEITIQVRVVDETLKKAIPGKIFHKKDCPSPTAANCPVIGIYDPNPKLPYLSIPCQRGQEIYATPTVPGYYLATRQGTYCYQANARIDMLATPFTLLIAKYSSTAGAAALAMGNYGDAVVLYSQANALNPSKATEKVIYTSLAKKLGVSEQEATYFDPVQNKDVPSALLVEKIKTFQAGKGLDADGLLGSRTQAAIANEAKPFDVLLKYSTSHPSMAGDRGS